MSHNLRSKASVKRPFGIDLRNKTQVAQYEANKGRADVSTSSNQSVSNANSSIFGLGSMTSGFAGGILKSANKQMRMRQPERVHFKDGDPDMCRISEGGEKSPIAKSATPKRPALHTPKKVVQSTPCKSSDPLKKKRPSSTPKHQKSEQPAFCIEKFKRDFSKCSLADFLSIKVFVDAKIQKMSEEEENFVAVCTPENTSQMSHSPQVVAVPKESHASSGQLSAITDVPTSNVEISQVETAKKIFTQESDIISDQISANSIISGN